MATKTITGGGGRGSVVQVQRLYNLHKELSVAAPVDITTNATTTITIVHTTETGAVTIDSSSTAP